MMEDTRSTTLEQNLCTGLIYEIGQTNLHQTFPFPENQEMIAGSPVPMCCLSIIQPSQILVVTCLVILLQIWLSLDVASILTHH